HGEPEFRPMLIRGLRAPRLSAVVLLRAGIEIELIASSAAPDLLAVDEVDPEPEPRPADPAWLVRGPFVHRGTPAALTPPFGPKRAALWALSHRSAPRVSPRGTAQSWSR